VLSLQGGAVVNGNVPPETLGSRPGSVVTGRDREVRGATHNWPSVVRVREGLAFDLTLLNKHHSPQEPVLYA
jgi:hypothetical protein